MSYRYMSMQGWALMEEWSDQKREKRTEKRLGWGVKRVRTCWWFMRRKYKGMLRVLLARTCSDFTYSAEDII